MALNERELAAALNYYLQNPHADHENRQRFIRDEVTYTDGSAGRRTGEFLLSLLQRPKGGWE